MGCKSSSSRTSTFHEFHHLSPDHGDLRYGTESGMYREGIGLEHVLLSWSSSEYMYAMLQHNGVALPEEAYLVLKLFPLVDWHSRGMHTLLSNETDREAHPFVVDFHDISQRVNESTMIRDCKELTGEECQALWNDHYSLIFQKYGAGDCTALEW